MKLKEKCMKSIENMYRIKTNMH